MMFERSELALGKRRIETIEEEEIFSFEPHEFHQM
jgi:hypothetical protein